jgi:hypothetical protein
MLCGVCCLGEDNDRNMFRRLSPSPSPSSLGKEFDAPGVGSTETTAKAAPPCCNISRRPVAPDPRASATEANKPMAATKAVAAAGIWRKFVDLLATNGCELQLGRIY